MIKVKVMHYKLGRNEVTLDESTTIAEVFESCHMPLPNDGSIGVSTYGVRDFLDIGFYSSERRSEIMHKKIGEYSSDNLCIVTFAKCGGYP